MAQLTELAQALADLDKKHVADLVEDKLKGGVPPLEILKDLNEGMIEVGNRFSACEYYISELIFSSHIYKEVIAKLDPLLGEMELDQSAGTVVIGTVKGDIHDIGKNIVVTLLRNAGFRTIDLGVDVDAERFVETVKESGAKALALSCLLNLAIQEMKTVVDAFVAAGIRDRVKVVIGGQPIDEKVCEYVGGDYYGTDAPAGVRICKQIYAQGQSCPK
jgi:methanogenic corrinoid protein MtbC1